MAAYAILLQSQLGEPIVDKTGLRGLYGFSLPMQELNDPLPPGDPATQASQRVRDLLPGKLEQHLGLRQEAAKTTVEILVVERVDKPPEN